MYVIYYYGTFRRLNDTVVPEKEKEVDDIIATVGTTETEAEDNIDAGTKPETEAEPKVQAEADTDIPTDPATEAIETLKLTCHPSVYNRIVEMYKRVSGVYLFNLFNIFIVYNIYILYIVIMLYMFLMCIDEYHVSDVW